MQLSLNAKKQNTVRCFYVVLCDCFCFINSNSFFPSIYWVPAICQTLQKAESEIKLPTSIGLEKKQGNSMEKTSICFIDYAKAFDCVDHNKLWEILQEMGIPDHLTCLLRNLYACQEATVRTGTWNNRLVPNRKRSTSRLYIVTLLI